MVAGDKMNHKQTNGVYRTDGRVHLDGWGIRAFMQEEMKTLTVAADTVAFV